MEGVLWLVFGWRAKTTHLRGCCIAKCCKKLSFSTWLSEAESLQDGHCSQLANCRIVNPTSALFSCQERYAIYRYIHIHYCTFCPPCSDGTFVPMQHQDLEFPSTRRSSGYSEGHSTVTRKAGYQRAPWCTRDPPLRHVNDTATGRYPHRSQWHFIYIYTYMHIILYVYMYACIFLCTRKRIIYIYIFIFLYIYIYFYIFIYISIYFYIYIYIYIFINVYGHQIIVPSLVVNIPSRPEFVSSLCTPEFVVIVGL